MTIAIQIIVDALSVGSLYALTALGIGLIFGIMRLINFAHGEFVTIGAYMLMAIVAQYEPLAIIVSMVLVVVLALLSERIAFRPVRHASPTTMLVTSFAVSYFLQYLFVMIYGARPKGFEFLAGLAEPFIIGTIRIPKLNVAIVGVTIVLLAGLALFLTRSRFGVQMRAAALNFRMARLLGVRADRVIAVAFSLSGVACRRHGDLRHRAGRHAVARHGPAVRADRLRLDHHRGHGQPDRRGAWRLLHRRRHRSPAVRPAAGD